MSVAAPTDATAIHLSGLHKAFNKTIAIDDVTLTIPGKRIFGFVGPDGAGKSTILKILTGLLTADRGTCSVFGLDTVREIETIRKTLGFVPQGLGLAVSSKLTIRQNLDFYADMHHLDRTVARERSLQLLKTTGLDPFQDRLAGHLSGGMQQKLCLCCTMLHHPRLLVLDEPTTGVDPVSRRDLWVIINDMVNKEGITVLIATSYLDEAERCHNVALVHNGNVIMVGDPDVLPRQHGCTSLQELFVSQMKPQAEHEFSPEKLSIGTGVDKPITSPDRPVVEVKQLVRKFGTFTAVDHVDFEIPSGAMYGFLGPNGAGKTTAIKILCGILAPTAGDAYVGGLHVYHQRRKLKNRIGYMSQKFSLYRDLKVSENLSLYRQIYGKQKHKVLESAELLEMVGLTGHENRITDDLPVGLRQRLALACSMVHLPDVLFLDEPTSGVDPLARERFWQIVRFLSRRFGITLLLTTHYMDEAEYCDRLAMINFGKIVAAGTPDELKQRTEREKGSLLEIVCNDYLRAKALIDTHVAPSDFFGRRLHIFTQTPDAHREKISHTLTSNGITDADIRTASIRLEDVFIHFARRQIT